jgi:galactose oxidase
LSEKSASGVVCGLSLHRLWLLVLAYLSLVSSVLGQACTTPNTCGQWSPIQNWPVEAIHATLLKTGKVLMWPGPRNTAGPLQTYLWDPQIVPVGSPPTPAPSPVQQQCRDNVFCGGHALLSDGKLLVTGGHNAASYTGLKATNVYDPNAGSWTKLADMNNGRWYPTTTALPSGDALVISGQINGGSPTSGSYNDLPQIWQSGSNLSSWRPLSNARMGLPYYPYMFVAPSGKIFMAGPWQQARHLTNFAGTGTGAWESPSPSLKSHLPTRNWGSAVMYEPGKVLIIGGINCGWYPGTNGCPTGPTNTAEFIDLTSGSPQWAYTGNNMVTGGRKLHNATLLPNGNVFVSGGSRGTEDPNNAPSNPTTDYALECEMWSPPPAGSGKGQWSKRASLQVFRAYHSIALLLPDGRVLSAGGDKANRLSTGVGGPSSAELYSPAYLFDSNNHLIPTSSRPAISSYPTTISYTSSFTVNFSNATSISKVTLLALGSVTHGFNMGQRFVNLSFTQGTGTLSVPSSQLDRYKAPPGYYMLFILNNSGVPSIAKIIQLH